MALTVGKADGLLGVIRDGFGEQPSSRAAVLVLNPTSNRRRDGPHRAEWVDRLASFTFHLTLAGSVASFLVDKVQKWLVAQKSREVVGKDRRDLIVVRRRVAAGMLAKDNVWQVPQR